VRLQFENVFFFKINNLHNFSIVLSKIKLYVKNVAEGFSPPQKEKNFMPGFLTVREDAARPAEMLVGGHGGMANVIADTVAGDARGRFGDGVNAGAGLPTLADAMSTAQPPNILLAGIVDTEANVTAPLFDFEAGAKGMTPADEDALVEAMALADGGAVVGGPISRLVNGAMVAAGLTPAQDSGDFGLKLLVIAVAGTITVLGGMFIEKLLRRGKDKGTSKNVTPADSKPGVEVQQPPKKLDSGLRRNDGANKTYELTSDVLNQRSETNYPDTAWFDIEGVLIPKGASIDAPLQPWAVEMLSAFRDRGIRIGLNTTNDAEYIRLFLENHSGLDALLSVDENGKPLAITGEQIDAYRNAMRKHLMTIGMDPRLADSLKPIKPGQVLVDDSSEMRAAILKISEHIASNVEASDDRKGMSRALLKAATNVSKGGLFYAGDIQGAPTPEQIAGLGTVIDTSAAVKAKMTEPYVDVIAPAEDSPAPTDELPPPPATPAIPDKTAGEQLKSLSSEISDPAIGAYAQMRGMLFAHRNPPNTVWMDGDLMFSNSPVALGMAAAFRDNGIRVGIALELPQEDVRDALAKRPEIRDMLSLDADGQPLVRDADYLRPWRMHVEQTLVDLGVAPDVASGAVDKAVPIDPDEMFVGMDLKNTTGSRIQAVLDQLEGTLGREYLDHDVAYMLFGLRNKMVNVEAKDPWKDMGVALSNVASQIRHRNFSTSKNHLEPQYAWPSRNPEEMLGQSKVLELKEDEKEMIALSEQHKGNWILGLTNPQMLPLINQRLGHGKKAQPINLAELLGKASTDPVIRQVLKNLGMPN
jgi:hypothetical protein